MSDFVNAGWALWVAGITIAGLVYCLVILMIASKRKVMANDNTTGHIWDEDLRELNNPLPRWWMWLFIITVVFAAIYLALYPGLGTNPGTFKWSSTGQWEAEQLKAREAMAPLYAKFTAMKPEELAKDAQAMGIGERLFANNCAQCHGADAHGSKGFPNLTDSDWLGGSGAEYIAKTVTHGRQGMMPPMAAAVGGPEDVKNVANYVLSLSDSAHNNLAAELGKSKFAACAACHGSNGKGNQALGAPNLTDKVWLHGWGEDAIVAMVNNGKTNIMPAFEKRLTPEQIQVLAAYVWSLSQTTAVAAAK
jgi:cytochrome c oxidase cbb3-type subunit 3